MEFELEDEESNSTKEDELEEEEPQTPSLSILVWERRQPERYTPPYFHSSFILSVSDDDPSTVREVVDSKDGKL
jgi:hypothetical protein